ncbi:unnamed protein product [Thelazia callipaeda]|uniref:Uncharacterized protein n=1 Tax=Thelazia callipaeda TaxID=103827 RepID=A0A0N5CJ38_THECL|nr:unnamed protein product [Thelazia callipaeda]
MHSWAFYAIFVWLINFCLPLSNANLSLLDDNSIERHWLLVPSYLIQDIDDEMYWNRLKRAAFRLGKKSVDIMKKARMRLG